MLILSLGSAVMVTTTVPTGLEASRSVYSALLPLSLIDKFR
jgi:hypothetical protein